MTPSFTYIKRDLEGLIHTSLNKGKVIIIYGPRQSGKTTLVKNFFERLKTPYLYLPCDETRIKEQLIPDSLALKRIIGNYQNIVFDEAQTLENPGAILKILIDNFPEANIIASGSSSFDLANKLNEPLTGRHYEFRLFPLTFAEISKIYPPTDWKFHLEQNLIFGSYPTLIKLTTDEEKINYLNLLTRDYLYKDILAFNLVRDSRKVRELLTCLALQTGSEVSYSELANTVSVDRKTIERFLDLLEKSFVLFRLYPFSRNLRSEINRKVKIYFYDSGVRNALINNFNPLNLRSDAGAILENYFIAEKIKLEANLSQKANFYFWRTHEQKEIDLIAEKNNKIEAFEIKLKGQSKPSVFKTFQSAYPHSSFKLVTIENIIDSLLPLG